MDCPDFELVDEDNDLRRQHGVEEEDVFHGKVLLKVRKVAAKRCLANRPVPGR